MYLKVRPAAFDPDALADLRTCADDLIARGGSDRTSLGHHMSSTSARRAIKAAVRRFYASEVPGLFSAKFGKVPGLNLGFTTIRQQAPQVPHTVVGWHLDLNFVYDSAPFLVAWVPLEAVGENRVGLEICVPKRPEDVMRLIQQWQQRSQAQSSLIFPDEEVDEAFGRDGYEARPLHLAAGSAVVFDQFVLHRTQRLSGATASRRSFEFRMVDLDLLPTLSRATDGLFCRPDPDADDGIGFMLKHSGGPLRPVGGLELDALNFTHGRR